MLYEVRCIGIKKNGDRCGKVLGFVQGYAEIKCPVCKTINNIDTTIKDMQKLKKMEKSMRNTCYDHTRMR